MLLQVHSRVRNPVLPQYPCIKEVSIVKGSDLIPTAILHLLKSAKRKGLQVRRVYQCANRSSWTLSIVLGEQFRIILYNCGTQSRYHGISLAEQEFRTRELLTQT